MFGSNTRPTGYPSKKSAWAAILVVTLGLIGCENVEGPQDFVESNSPPDVNAAPRAVATANPTTVESGDVVTLDGSQSNDTDGNVVAYAWAQTVGTSVDMQGADTSSATFTAPVVTAPELLTFELIVTDNENSTSRAVVDVQVTPVIENRPPVANAGIDFTASIQSTVTLDGSASSDPDGDNINYLWTNDEGVIALSNANTAVATFEAPDVMVATEYTFTLTVTDIEGLTNADAVVVTIDPVFNMPPVANAGIDQTVMGTDTVVLDGSASTDSDGTIAAYLWEQTAGPNVTINNSTAAQASFTAPDVNSTTLLTFRLTVTDDNNAIGTDTVDITVTQLVNDAPNADAGPDFDADGWSSPEILDGAGSSDNDGTIDGYQWTQTVGTRVTINNSNAQMASFETPNEAEVLTFELTVTDNRGATGTDTVNVNVTPVNIDPNCSNHPGEQQWAVSCASCHGSQNQGGTRARADIQNLINNGTMQDENDIAGLVNYISIRMPPPGGSCTGTCAYRTGKFLLEIENAVCSF